MGEKVSFPINDLFLAIFQWGGGDFAEYTTMLCL